MRYKIWGNNERLAGKEFAALREPKIWTWGTLFNKIDIPSIIANQERQRRICIQNIIHQIEKNWSISLSLFRH